MESSSEDGAHLLLHPDSSDRDGAHLLIHPDSSDEDEADLLIRPLCRPDLVPLQEAPTDEAGDNLSYFVNTRFVTYHGDLIVRCVIDVSGS